MDETTTLQGREITQDDIELVRRLIEANPCRNRTRLSQELCLLWNWRAANGRIKDMAADARLVSTDEDIIAVAGTRSGADTAIVVRPVNSQDLFELKVKEILCKPSGW